MTELKEKKTAFKWLEKLKKIKHIELYIAIIFLVVILLIYLSNFSGGNKSKSNDEMNVGSYIEQLEENLEDILSNIGGVSNVKVMITLDMATANIENENISLSAFPAIKGVLITAKGVDNTTTKLKVLHAVEALIDIRNGNIEILSSD
jgi:type III secretory pathway lipoprotein EscJ